MRGHRRPSEAIGGNQRHSEAIRGRMAVAHLAQRAEEPAHEAAELGRRAAYGDEEKLRGGAKGGGGVEGGRDACRLRSKRRQQWKAMRRRQSEGNWGDEKKAIRRQLGGDEEALGGQVAGHSEDDPKATRRRPEGARTALACRPSAAKW